MAITLPSCLSHSVEIFKELQFCAEKEILDSGVREFRPGLYPA
jgi:hypothetical protein